LLAPRSGVIESAVALSGTLLKGVGEEVQAGESIAGGYFLVNDEKKSVRVVAKACLVCVEQVVAESEELAYAQGLLLVEGIGGELRSITYEQGEQGIVASVEFMLTIKKNM
jgi:hypothetical protein